MTKDEFEGQNFSLAVLFVLPLWWKREEDAAIRARQQPALLEQLRIPRRCLRMRSRARVRPKMFFLIIRLNSPPD